MLITQSFKYPFRRVSLLLWNQLICLKGLINRNRELREVVKGGDIYAAVKFCVENKLNMIVSGGTSTGKTVAARKILSYVGNDERIITIEEAAELLPDQPNVVTLISNRDVKAQSADVLLTSNPSDAA